MFRHVTVPTEIMKDAGSDDEDDQYMPNPHYNLEFLEYLIINIFPMGCLFDHSLIYLHNSLVTNDTNNPVESWNSVSMDNSN